MKRLNNISNRDVVLILIGFFAGAVAISLVAHFMSTEVNLWSWLDGFAQNFGTEMFGAFLTFLLIELLLGSRKRRDDVIQQLGSRDNAVAAQAANELRDTGALVDGSLRGRNFDEANLANLHLRDADFQAARLVMANLEGTDLTKANLRQSQLMGANLANANLTVASLEGAKLWSVKLQGAQLINANLSGADLLQADLEKAQLKSANLSGASLGGANLRTANLRYAILDDAELDNVDLTEAALKGASIRNIKFTTLTLPDGTRGSTDDLDRFIDPSRPDFWPPVQPSLMPFGPFNPSDLDPDSF